MATAGAASARAAARARGVSAERKSATAPGAADQVMTVDCRVGMRSLPDDFVSLVLTDPPYFIDGMDSEWDDSRLRARTARGGVVSGLPAGMKYDPGQSRALRSFLSPVAEEWMRVARPGAFVLCFMQPRLAHAAGTAMEDAGIEIRDLYFWRRPGQAKAFSQDHFVRKRRGLSEAEKRRISAQLGGRKTPQLRPMGEAIVMGQVPREGTFVDNWLRWRTGLIDVSEPLLEPESFPGTIMEAERPRNRHGHMAAKPVDLLRHLIRIFCADDPECVVMDPFAGCGSTGEAAALEGRGFIGFETEPEYAKRANRRIREALAGA